MGEFRFDHEFGVVPREQFVENKQNLFENVPEYPVFIYMHSDLPSHSQNSGTCLSNESDLYKDRLSLANTEMQQDINIINDSDPSSIIIVAGDHGPFLTKNCNFTTGHYSIDEISRLDIQDRYGTFLAIRWPTDDYVEYDSITVLQDLFPAIFAYLYQDESILNVGIEPITFSSDLLSGVFVDNGIIMGGINDGEPLFLSDR